jgi:hypothetical protein
MLKKREKNNEQVASVKREKKSTIHHPGQSLAEMESSTQVTRLKMERKQVHTDLWHLRPYP